MISFSSVLNHSLLGSLYSFTVKSKYLCFAVISLDGVIDDLFSF